MLRAALLFGFLTFCWLVASSAEACEPFVPRNPGETEAHAYERLRRADQDRYWAEADTVFVATVYAISEGYRRFEVKVVPRTSFKGDAGTEIITYDLDYTEVACDRAAFPDFRDVGLFYASRENDRLKVRGMLGPNDIEDDTLRARVLRELEPGELTDLAMETPPHDRRPLVLAALISFCAFIGGILIGRMGRKRTVA